MQAGKQVAVLVPTTLLAQQHYTTFVDRFADWPVRIESLSRFRSNKQAADILDGVAEGRVDIVIATQRLLQGKARFKDLGLVVIDEEHRFGVRDKEKLKALRTEVDVLTLTRDADSAHLEHGHGRFARSFADHDAARGTAGSEDLCARVERNRGARGVLARDPARRPDLLRAQHHRDHREDGAGDPQARAGGECRGRARPDARARPGAAHARLLSPPLQRACLHHHHRKRHRRAHGEHHHHRPRGPLRSGADPPTARPASAARITAPMPT